MMLFMYPLGLGFGQKSWKLRKDNIDLCFLRCKNKEAWGNFIFIKLKTTEIDKKKISNQLLNLFKQNNINFLSIFVHSFKSSF